MNESRDLYLQRLHARAYVNDAVNWIPGLGDARLLARFSQTDFIDPGRTNIGSRGRDDVYVAQFTK